MKYMKSLLILAAYLSINLGCINSNSNQNEPIIRDTLQRPPQFSEKASLLNYGSDVEQIPVWAEYLGPLTIDGKTYSHIPGIKYFWVKANKADTMYYENLDLRTGKKEFGFKNCKISDSSGGGANVQLLNAKESIWLFYVLETNEFNREYKGIEFKNMPAIRTHPVNGIVSADLIEFNLTRKSNTDYVLTVTDGSKLLYRLSSTCKEEPTMTSFLNRQDGRIYFINRDCYLELVNKEDIEKLKD